LAGWYFIICAEAYMPLGIDFSEIRLVKIVHAPVMRLAAAAGIGMTILRVDGNEFKVWPARQFIVDSTLRATTNAPPNVQAFGPIRAN